MNYFEQIIYDRQGSLIKELNEENFKLKNKLNIVETELHELKRHKNYYKILTDVIQNTPALQSEWSKFMTLIKLAAETEEIEKLK